MHTSGDLDPRDLAVMSRCPVSMSLCVGALLCTVGHWYGWIDPRDIDLHPRAFTDQPWRILTACLAASPCT